MKSKLFILTLFSPVIFLAGCATVSGIFSDLATAVNPNNSEKLEKVNQKIEESSQKTEERSRALTTGVVEALNLEQNPSVKVEVALALAKEDQLIEGLPVEPFDVKQIISRLESEKEATVARGRATIERIEAENLKLRQERDELNRRQESIEENLIEKGMQKEEEEKSDWLKSTLGWFWATFGLGGTILFVVLFPGVILPVFTNLVGWLVRTFPALISSLGIAAKKTTDNIIKGVEKARDNFKKASSEKLFTKDEVLEILNGNLRETLDEADKKVVQQRKAFL